MMGILDPSLVLAATIELAGAFFLVFLTCYLALRVCGIRL